MDKPILFLNDAAQSESFITTTPIVCNYYYLLKITLHLLKTSSDIFLKQNSITFDTTIYEIQDQNK